MIERGVQYPSTSPHHLQKRGKGRLQQNPRLLSARRAEIVHARAPSALVNMSRLRFSLLFGVVVLLVAASASASSRPPEVYSVGHETGRAAALGDDDVVVGAQTTTLSEWATRQRFYIGDVLDFERSSDSVLLVRQSDYERCSAASPARRFFAGGGDTRFTLARHGLFYFISGTPARCEAGERMVVRVVDPLSGVPTPAPVPAPGTQPADDDTLSKRRRRTLTVAEMQMVAGALGFVAGFVTTFLIVWFCICCCP